MTTTETETPFEFNGPKIAKAVARFVVKHSVSTTIATVIAQSVEVEKKNQKVQIFIGSYVLGMMAADAGWNRVEQQIANTTYVIQKVRSSLEEEQAKKESPNITDL